MGNAQRVREMSLKGKVLFIPLGIILLTFILTGIILTSLSRESSSIITLIIIVLSISFLTLTLVLHRVCKGIIRRLARLREAFSKQANGDLTYDVLVTSRDEIYICQMHTIKQISG